MNRRSAVREFGEVISQLVVVVVVEAFDSGFLDREVALPGNGLPANRERDPFNLAAIRENDPPDRFLILTAPRVLDLGQTMLDAVLPAAHVEHVRDPGCGRAVGVARREGELDAPRHCLSDQWRSNGSIGQNRVDLVGNRLDQGDEKGRGGDPRGLCLQPDKGEFARPINGYEEMELPFGSLDLGDVDVEVADRIGLELLLRGRVACDVRQTRDVVALQTAVQRRAAQMWDPSPLASNQWRTMARPAMNTGNRPAAAGYACERRR